MLYLNETQVSWYIYFSGEKNGQQCRRSISLSKKKYQRNFAKELLEIVGALTYYRNNKIVVPDKKVEFWVENSSLEIREKLANVDLIEMVQETPARTCKELWDEFMKTPHIMREIKDSTRETYYHARRRFFDFFKEKESLQELSPARMLQWKDFLRASLEETTIAGTLTKAKAVFNWAVSSNWIAESPLKGVGRGSFVNRKNDRFVKMDEYFKLLEYCPCQDWRCIIALARIGGLRCPSELLRLKWEDIDWEKNQFHVHSSKTEHHKGKAIRTVPIFAFLREELERLFFHDSSEGAEYVINRYRDPKSNIITQFNRIARKAGMEPIKRPFDNMRMSRSNEIYARWGAFKEELWIGHTSRVRKDHYLMIQESDYDEAARWDENSGKESSPRKSSSDDSFSRNMIEHENSKQSLQRGED